MAQRPEGFLNVYRGGHPRKTDDLAPVDAARRDQRVVSACGPPEPARHGESPFRVLVMSSEFAGKSRVDRHRLVIRGFADLKRHALELS